MKTWIESMVSTVVVRGLVDRLNDRNLPVSQLLAAAEIKPAHLDDPSGFVPFRSYVELFEAAAEVMRDPLIGIAVATDAGPEALGALGFLFLNSSTLGEGLDKLCRYVAAVQDATDHAVESDGELASIIYQIRDDRIAARRQDAEYSLGVIIHLIRSYAAGRCRPVEVHLEHAPQVDHRRYEALFGCPVYFRQTRNAVIIEARHLDISSAERNDVLGEILEKQVRERAAARSTTSSICDHVNLALTPTSIREKVNAERVARKMHVSPSTLYRRLQSEQQSFQRLLDSRREALAKRLLADSVMSVAEVASALGYSENASFTRAFRRWTSVSPRQYRDAARTKAGCRGEAA